MQEELETIHKKVDELTKVIIRTQQQHSPTEEKAGTPSHRQKLEDTEQQETLTEHEETRNNKPSITAIAQDHEPPTKRPSDENHIKQATQNETIIKHNKRSKIEVHKGIPSTTIPEDMIIEEPPDMTSQYIDDKLKKAYKLRDKIRKEDEQKYEQTMKEYEQALKEMAATQRMIRKENKKSGNSTIPPLPCGQPHDKEKERRGDS